MNWRDARVRMTYEHHLFLRKLRHSGNAPDLMDKSDDELWKMAEDYALEAVKDAAARWDAEH